MSELKIKQNNKGASLIMVIIALLFVGIIAAIVLSLTNSNIRNVFSRSSSSGNFYSAEKALDEIKSKLQEYADDAARAAYTDWLQKYSSLYNGNESKTAADLFIEMYVAELADILNDKVLKGGTGLIDIADLLIEVPVGAGPGMVDVSWIPSHVPTIVVTDPQKLILKDVGIKYVDSNGFASYITTDLEFTMEYPGMLANAVINLNLPCSNYAIIADEKIVADAGNDITVEGSLYGGGYNVTEDKYTNEGISVSDGSTLNVKARYMLTRNLIKLEGKAKLNVEGSHTGYSELSYCNVWAKDIDLGSKVDGGVIKNEPTAVVKANVHLSDDLTLDAERSSFVMDTGSKFYGYNTSNAKADDIDRNGAVNRTGTPDGSSAIVINGKNSTLDLSKAGEVWVAGKTFISVPNIGNAMNIYNGSDTTGDKIETAAFMQGESVSYRAMQAAYLLPGECVAVGHNPMTIKEYVSILNPSTGKLVVDTSKNRIAGNIDLDLYVNATDPVRVAFVRYKSGDKNDIMVYLYLNFISTNAATEYFKEYSTINRDLVVARMKQFGASGNILINSANLTNTGNVVTYKTNTVGASTEYDINILNSTYNSATVEKKQIDLTTKFKALTTSLDEKNLSLGMATRLTDSIVDLTQIDEIAGKVGTEGFELLPYTDSVAPDAYAYSGVYTEYDLTTGNPIAVHASTNGICGGATVAGAQIGGTNCKLYVKRGDLSLGSGSGIVIVDGNVTVNPDATFYGLIIATGKITLGSGARVINSPVDNLYVASVGGVSHNPNYVIKYIIQNDETVQKCFKIVEDDEDESINGLSTMDLIDINYQNWKKE